MVWKNPFQMKNSEEQVREREFLALFDCAVLQMIDEGNFSKVSFVSSTPGAGKTSLFRAFTPKILSTIIIPEHIESLTSKLKQAGADIEIEDEASDFDRLRAQLERLEKKIDQGEEKKENENI